MGNLYDVLIDRVENEVKGGDGKKDLNTLRVFEAFA